jgi:YjbE family integral membrane protein
LPDLLSSGALARFVGVLAVNLLLSGDNAVVIALAVRRLKGATRRRAVLLGAGGAVALRLVFAVVVTFLLEIPLLQAVGGALLFWIAWQLAEGDPEEEAGERVRAGGGLWQAVRIIIVADVIMSLDNVIALVGVSGGNLLILGFGLLLTIPLVVWGATLLSSLLDLSRGIETPVSLAAAAAFVALILLWERVRSR